MKKLINLVCILVLSFGVLFAQENNSYSADANRNTALRCLKIAESCLIGKDWDNALSQAELGLTYDDSISDLIYVKAAASINLNKPKAQVIELIEQAFLKNDWVGYTVKGARILYADLLSDVGRYSKSMMVLDEEPFLFSADAEFIRIKNLYRMGTVESLKDARLKINSSRRIYPNDKRFPHLFFMFEMMYLNEAHRIGMEYKIPDIVNTIAQSYIAKLPDYVGDNLDIELMAAFFANQEEKARLIKAIDAKGQSDNSLLAYEGLSIGFYSEQQAYDLFFESAEDSIHLGLLENFALLLKEDDVKKQLVEKLLNYNGSIYIDEDFDLQPELIVKYETGRPQIISYDYNNDGILDLYSTCDFGAPNFVYLGEKKAKIFYSAFPSVSKIAYVDEDYVLNFLHDDYKMSVMDFTTNNILSNLGLEFYIPNISKEIVLPEINQLILSASSLELPIEERENSKVVYTAIKGNLVFADFYENDKKYAYCDFSKGFPITRYVDHDDNGSFETKELYNISESNEDFITDKELNFVERIFSEVAFNSPIYLMKVELDRNGNTYDEFSEQYLGLGGKITIWDNDDNGIPDSQYIKYPQEENTQLREDSIFFDKNGNPHVVINFLDKIPVKMSIDDTEVNVFAGNSDNFYWVGEEGNINFEKFILDTLSSKLINGNSAIVQLEDTRGNVIKVNDNIFCKIVPASRTDLLELLSEYSNEAE